ncbi:glycosyltransferase [Epilithonimonas sp.]|uniref:glycosyltransferase n=1 Tax=Epilithonimonas sp. TaxID=2894511 RepID=UPI0035B057AE
MKKKLLFIYYQNIKSGGVSKVLVNLVNELVDKDYEVDVLFLMAEHQDFYPIDARVHKHYLDAFSFWTFKICKFNKKYLNFVPKLNNINAYIYQLGVGLLMNRWLKKHHSDYNVIIPCWYKLSCTLALNKKVSHKTIAWEHNSHKVGGFFWNRLKAKYKNINKIICLNSADKDFYKSINPETYIIANIMDADIESQDFIPNKNKENIITMIARLEPEKNVPEFLEIINEVNLPKDWKVEIIGDGSQMAALKDYIKFNSLNNVFILGELDTTDVKKHLSKSKINCLTSVSEGFGMVLIEAMFSSNALIAYDCPSGPAEIINTKNGFLIKLGDKKSFKTKLDFLVNNPSQLEQMMHSAFLKSEKWKREHILKKWQHILN